MSCVRPRCSNCEKLLRRKDNCCRWCGFITSRGVDKLDSYFVKKRQVESQIRVHGIIGWMKAHGKITEEDVKRYEADEIAKAVDRYFG